MSKIRDPLAFYRATITPEYVEGLLRGAGIAPRTGIFTAVIVVWLMIAQRLSGDGSLSEAVESLRGKRERELLALSRTSGRARTGRISSRTGGYSQARKRLPIELVEQVADRLNEEILKYHRSRVRVSQDVFVIDGSTLRVAHTPDNLCEYGPYENQHGEAHFPLVRICVATHVETGIITRPTFGPHNGAEAVSELGLSETLLARLPKESTVIADRYFGCFRFAWFAHQQGLSVILRMKVINAASVLGLTPKGVGEKEVLWTPSKFEQAKYPALANISLRGRFVWCPLVERGQKKEMLVLFTTTALPMEKVIASYERRWLVETDLRDLKSTLKMNFIDAKSPEMIAKEIILGSCAYNLIRHVISTAAVAAKIQARRFSFSAALRRVRVLATASFANLSDEHMRKALNTAFTELGGLVLPIRAGPRDAEPRKVWRKGQFNYFSDSRQNERKKVQKRKKTMLNQNDAP